MGSTNKSDNGEKSQRIRGRAQRQEDVSKGGLIIARVTIGYHRGKAKGWIVPKQKEAIVGNERRGCADDKIASEGVKSGCCRGSKRFRSRRHTDDSKVNRPQDSCMLLTSIGGYNDITEETNDIQWPT